MKTCQKLFKSLATVLLSALLLGIVFVTAGSSGPNTASGLVSSALGMVDVRPATPAASGETNTINPNPPGEVVKLVFIHHFTGAHWLDDWDGRLGLALGNHNYFASDTSYGWGPDSIGNFTDIGHWWTWFCGPRSSTYLSALYDLSDQNSIYSRWLDDPGGENEIILVKSCFPNSQLGGNPDDPPTSGDNPLRGQDSWSEHHTVGNAKGIYNDILEYFGTRQDKLFVVITAPPHQDATYAANARALNNWLVYEWLEDYPYHNVVVFDFYNVLTTNGGDPDTNDYGWSTGNHHRVVTTTTPITIEHIIDGDDDANPDVLEYPSNGDTHPNLAGNRKATGEFVPLLDAYYNCWKHGDCWDGATDWISVTAVADAAAIYPGEMATFTFSLAASEGFAAPVTLTLQGEPPGTVASFDPNPVIPPGTSQLTLTTTASTVAGTYPITVTGTADQVTDAVSVTLVVSPAFTLRAEPEVHVVPPGDTAVYALSVTANEGFDAPITLALQGAPAETFVSFEPNPVIPPGTSQLTLTTTTSTVSGIYSMTVAGVSGTLTETAQLNLIVTSATPSFTLSVSPTVRIAKLDQAVSYTVAVSGINGFSQPVTLVVVGLPAGVGTDWSLNPVTPGNSSTLTLSIPSNPSFGDHLLHIVGTSETQVVAERIKLVIDYPCKLYFPIVLSDGQMAAGL